MRAQNQKSRLHDIGAVQRGSSWQTRGARVMPQTTNQVDGSAITHVAGYEGPARIHGWRFASRTGQIPTTCSLWVQV